MGATGRRPAGPSESICDPWLMRWVAVRNTLIICAIAALGLVWDRGLSAIAISTSQIVLVLFLAAMVGFGYKYFRDNRLAWLVLRPWQRAVIIVAAVAIAALVILGPTLLQDRLTIGGVLALIAALVLLILWIVRQSRRLP
jgi:hypothetical protein